MHSIIKSIIKFKNKINQTKKESNEQIIHSKHQFNYSINNNELQKNNKNNIKTTRKSLINRLHNRQSSNEKSINQYNNNNNNQLWNDQDDHLNVLDNHQQINDQLMTSLKLINNLPNYEDLDHDHNDDYQEYKQTIQQINSILSNSIIINPNYTEEELNKELEKLLNVLEIKSLRARPIDLGFESYEVRLWMSTAEKSQNRMSWSSNAFRFSMVV